MFWPSFAQRLANFPWAGFVMYPGQPELWPFLSMFLVLCHDVLPFDNPLAWNRLARVVVSLVFANLFVFNSVRHVAALAHMLLCPTWVPPYSEYTLRLALWSIPEILYWLLAKPPSAPAPHSQGENQGLLYRLRRLVVPRAPHMSDTGIEFVCVGLGQGFGNQLKSACPLFWIPVLRVLPTVVIDQAVPFARDSGMGLFVYVPVYVAMIYWVEPTICVFAWLLNKAGAGVTPSWVLSLMASYKKTCDAVFWWTGCFAPSGEFFVRQFFTVYMYYMLLRQVWVLTRNSTSGTKR